MAGGTQEIPGEPLAGSGGSGKMPGGPSAGPGESRKMSGGPFAGSGETQKTDFTPPAGLFQALAGLHETQRTRDDTQEEPGEPPILCGL
jgi:hypothetical protein